MAIQTIAGVQRRLAEVARGKDEIRDAIDSGTIDVRDARVQLSIMAVQLQETAGAIERIYCDEAVAS